MWYALVVPLVELRGTYDRISSYLHCINSIRISIVSTVFFFGNCIFDAKNIQSVKYVCKQFFIGMPSAVQITVDRCILDVYSLSLSYHYHHQHFSPFHSLLPHFSIFHFHFPVGSSESEFDLQFFNFTKTMQRWIDAQNRFAECMHVYACYGNWNVHYPLSMSSHVRLA